MNTEQQHIENTEAAISFWATVPPETVITDLKSFRECMHDVEAPSCDSMACFGGWLPYAEHFANLGLVRDDYGAPQLTHQPNLSLSGVSFALFGCELLFEPRADVDPKEYSTASDHRIVTNRLLANLKKLKAQTNRRNPAAAKTEAPK